MMQVTNDTLNLLASTNLSLFLLDLRFGRATPTAQKMLYMTDSGWLAPSAAGRKPGIQTASVGSAE